MKIIFLDIDGVVNSINNAIAIGKITGKRVPYGPTFVEAPFTRENLNWGAKQVENLRSIVSATGASIVIISTWREKFQWAHMFIDMFYAYGWQNAPVSSCTPMYGMDRGSEIDEWIQITNSYQAPITSYVILDDNNDFSREQSQFLVLTDKQVGLTINDAQQAIKILNRNEGSHSV